MSETITIASFDIGKKNFCFYIEECNTTQFEEIVNIPYEKRYNENGTPTEEMKTILDNVGLNGKTISHVNKDLTYNTDKSKYLDKEIYFNMIDHLDEYKELFDTCSIIIIEQQMSRNSMAMKLGQHCFSYFACRYGRDKEIVEFPSYNKTCILGAERTKGKKYKNGNYKWKTMDSRTRKKWAVTKTYEILKGRGEEDTMNNIKTKAKKDDLSDTICQLVAYKYLHFIDKTI